MSLKFMLSLWPLTNGTCPSSPLQFYWGGSDTQSECAAIACLPFSLQPPGSPPPALRRAREPCELAFFYHHRTVAQQNYYFQSKNVLQLLLMLCTRNNTDVNKFMIFFGIALYYGDTCYNTHLCVV